MSILNEKSYFTYSTVPQDDKNVESGYKTAFDYDSIFSYASPFKTEQEGNAKPAAGEKSADTISPEGISGKIISVLALVCSYLVIFFTLPVTVWFCFKNLPQWERIVVYRLGKLRGVKGPGNVFVIPWLDCSTKLDLRTQVIVHPVKQVTEFLLFNYRLLIFYFISSVSDKGSGNRRSRLQRFLQNLRPSPLHKQCSRSRFKGIQNSCECCYSQTNGNFR